MKKYFAVAVLGWACASCRFSENEQVAKAPLSATVFWEGHTAISYSVDSSGKKGSMQNQANPDSTNRFDGTISHTLEFVGADTVSLVLHEFDREYLAFSAFQNQAAPSELGDGFYRERNDLIFFHGRFLGKMQYTRAGLIPVHFLKENLSFLGEELFARPPEFKSFPLLGRIAKSERLISDEFMGKHWPGPVFSVQYRCHEDTATVFRSSRPLEDSLHAWLSGWKGHLDTLNWGREIHFQGQNESQEALVFWAFPTGILGISGCYDPVLATTYAEKMEKMTVLWPKP